MPSNLAQRILVSVIAIPVIFGITWLGGYAFLALIVGIVFLSQREFYAMCRVGRIETHEVAGIIAGLLIPINLFFFHDHDFAGLTLFIFVGLMLIELRTFKPDQGVFRIAVTLLGLLYAAFLPAHAILLRELHSQFYLSDSLGIGFIFLALIPTWINDTAAYGFGKKFGKRKFCPAISPNKSVEGSVFGLLFSILSVIALKLAYADYLSWADSAYLGLLIGVIGQLGDLIESLIKRDMGVKDSSNILPGHGGVLDRLDASFLTIPATYYFLRYFVF